MQRGSGDECNLQVILLAKQIGNGRWNMTSPPNVFDDEAAYAEAKAVPCEVLSILSRRPI
jgi:hypothetical protein